MSSQTTATTRLIYSQQRSNNITTTKTALIASSRHDKTSHATLVWVVILNPHGCSCGFVGRVGRAESPSCTAGTRRRQQLAIRPVRQRTRTHVAMHHLFAKCWRHFYYPRRACLSQYRLCSSTSPTACDELHAQGTVLRGLFARVVRVEVQVEQVAPLCFTCSFECVLRLCSPSHLLVLLCSPSQLLVLVRLTSQFYYVSRNSSPRRLSFVCRSSTDCSVFQTLSNARARYPPAARRVP